MSMKDGNVTHFDPSPSLSIPQPPLAGWWSYEFCYGREVKQYHFENGAIQGETISLGKFESDYNWEKSEEWESSSKTPAKKRKHHSQYYVDGSTCDLTGEPRKTEVRFKCDESLTGAGKSKDFGGVLLLYGGV